MNLKNFFLFCIFCVVSLPAWTKEKNYYEVLEVSQTATQEEIQKAYRQQAQKWHPDKHPSEEKDKITEKFQEIQKAYDTLKDIQKRKRYDQFGHKNWTTSTQSQNQAEDFYSGAFKNIFNKTDSISIRPIISQKSLYLFKNLILFQFKDLMSLKDSEDKSNRDLLLKQLFAELKISGLDKKTRERIAQDIAPSYIQEIKDIIDLNIAEKHKEEHFRQSLRNFTTEKEEHFRQSLIKFITEVEHRYMVEEITIKERQAVELFYQFSFFNQRLNDFLTKQKRKLELLNKEQEKRLNTEEKQELDRFQKEERQDLLVFRKILSSLGLPSQTHHEFLLRNYLDALKNTLFNKKFGKDLLSFDSDKPQQRFYMEDKEIIKALKQVKVSFDSIHYENLRVMSNPFKLPFLKNFPGQFVIFQAAIGASLYRQTLTDPQYYGADRNPELLMETMKHSLTPTGIASFFIFVAVSQQLNYRLYGWGQKLDGKSLGKLFFNGQLLRAIAPGAGLGLGFFASSLFDELIRDPHMIKCAKTLYKTAPVELVRDHTSACDNFYNNWSQSEKWKHYAVDIFTLIGSGVLSHKFINSILYGLHLTRGGSNLLIGITKTVGLRLTGWASFFIHMYFFMEFHKILDAYLGQPMKEQLSAGGIKNNLLELSDHLSQDLHEIPFFNDLAQNNSDLEEHFSEALKRIQGRIKVLGSKFKSWTEIVGRAYNQSSSLWLQQTNKLLLPYESSSNLLKDLFVLAQFSYNSEVVEGLDWDSDKQVNEDSIKLWNRLNTLSWFDFSTFEKDIEYYQKKYCPQVNKNLLLWNSFCLNSKGFFENGELRASYNTVLFFETAELIYNYLRIIPLNRSYELNPINYIGLGDDELFSSDPQYSINKLNYGIIKYPNQKIKKLTYDKKFELSRLLIKTGLDWENSLSYLTSNQIFELKSKMCADFFPNYETDSDYKELYNYCRDSSAYLTKIKEVCQSWYPDDSMSYEECVDFFNSVEIALKQKLGLKMLSAGVYLLRDIIFELGKKSPRLYKNPPAIDDIQMFLPILDLIESMKVYKKGEQKFVLERENFVQYKNQLNTDQERDYLEKQFELSNPYVLMKNMICDSSDRQFFHWIPFISTEDEKEEFLFVSKKFFNTDSLLMYNLSSNQYQTIDKSCENLTSRNSRIHEFLFDIPTQLEGKNYENLYLAVEELLKNYSSSQELKQAFKSVSQKQLDNIGGKISQDLDLITENYYREIIELESPVHINSSLEDFSNYYNKNRIRDIRSFTGGLKGLEISIFQVNYWLNTLKILLLTGEQTQLNSTFDSFTEEFKFDQEKFEIMQTEILSLLQSYNDTFKKAQGPYFTFPDKKIVEEIKLELDKAESVTERKTSLLDKLRKEYSSSANPIIVSPDIILSHVLAYSIPIENSLSQISMIQGEGILNTSAVTEDLISEGLVRKERVFQLEWKDLIDSVMIELNKSFNNFFTQLQPLQLKENFEDQVNN